VSLLLDIRRALQRSGDPSKAPAIARQPPKTDCIDRLRRDTRSALLERGEHRRRRRPNTAPHTKRLGGLLDEHAPALDRARATQIPGPSDESGVGFTVRHVVTDGLLADDGGGYLGNLSAEARGSRIHDQVERAGRDLAESNT